MSARFNIGLMSNSREFNRMQDKLDNLYDNYNYNSTYSNLSKTADIIDETNNMQRKLHSSMENIASEGAVTSVKPSCSYYSEQAVQCYLSCCYPYPSPYTPCRNLASTTAAAIAATTAAAVNNDLALRRTLNKKNAEICDLSMKYKKELSDLECQLNTTRLNNCELKDKLNDTKKELMSERNRSISEAQEKNANICNLKSELKAAECQLSLLEPRAKLAIELEKHICDLKNEIQHVRTSNRVLVDQNTAQAEIIIRSRPASPCFLARSRPVSPCLSRSPSLRRFSRPSSACSLSRVRSHSPISPNNCTQLLRQDLLVKRFEDLYSRDRLAAMDSLRSFSDNYENNQRIIFSAVQSAFTVAKKSFSEWKIRARSTVAITHCGPETLEEAVQCYINRNVDAYDLPCLVSEVIIALNCNPKIRLPLGVSYSIISTFIREACRTAWEMSALAFPLDTAFALDAEVFDETRYRKTYDSDYGAPLVNHHVWPCLMQGLCVLSRGEASTKRGASLYIRPSSPIRCSRSKSPCRKGILRAKSAYFCY